MHVFSQTVVFMAGVQLRAGHLPSIHKALGSIPNTTGLGVMLSS